MRFRRVCLGRPFVATLRTGKDVDVTGRRGRGPHVFALLDKRLRFPDQFAIVAVDDEDLSLFPRLSGGGDFLAVLVFDIQQHDGCIGVIIPDVVGHLLVPPCQLARFRVDRNDRVEYRHYRPSSHRRNCRGSDCRWQK